jgi:hypothetical protein
MRRLILALCLASTLPVLAAGDASTYEALTVDSTAGGVAIATATLTPTSGQWAGKQFTYCEARLETAQVRFTDDGTTVTTTEGTILEIGDVWTGSGHAILKRARFIRTGSTSGSLRIRCYQGKP